MQDKQDRTERPAGAERDRAGKDEKNQLKRDEVTPNGARHGGETGRDKRNRTERGRDGVGQDKPPPNGTEQSGIGRNQSN